MNLQPLYELQERLEQAAVAGTNLLGEDFRLKRAMEGLAPLAAASPVFAKIGAALEELLSAPPQGRGGVLLDTLALVDAVVYTQGKTGCPGTLEPLPHGIGTCQPLTYTQLGPLLAALNGTGSDRYHTSEEFWNTHPEYFTDYRVLPLLVKGLKDTGFCMAERNRDRLIQLGTLSFPLLKADFDPAGKREMVFRVNILDKVAGAAENDFYRAQLPHAKREVRQALIAALRHDPANLPLLLELCQKERTGKNQDQAWKTLAQLDHPEVEAVLYELSRKDWRQLLYILDYTPEPIASHLTVRLFEEELAPFEAEPERPLTEENASRFSTLLHRLKEKTGPEVCQLYRHAAALAPVLERSLDGSGQTPNCMRFSHYTALNSDGLLFGEYLGWILANTLMLHPDRALCALALELYEEYGTSYFIPALTVQLLCLDSAECYQWAEAQLPPDGPLRRWMMQAFVWILGYLRWSPEKETYFFHQGCYDYQVEFHWYDNYIANLDVRWFLLLTQNPDPPSALWRELLFYREVIPGLSPQVLDFLYGQIFQGLDFSPTHNIIDILHTQGWSDWDDLVVKLAKSRAMQRVGIRPGHIFSFLDALPVPPKQKAAQLQKIDQLVLARKLQTEGIWPRDQVQEHIKQWRQQASTPTN